MTSDEADGFGLGRGKVFPAAHAKSLLNPLRRVVQSPSRTVAAIGLRHDSRVLELGCGPGFFSPSIAAATEGAGVLFDLQAEMLRMARTRVTTAAVQGDGSRLPFAPACFDTVFIATVLGEIPDKDRCLDDVRAVLRPGGVLAVAETRRDSDFIKLDALTAMIEPHGFARVAVRGRRWQYVATFRAC